MDGKVALCSLVAEPFFEFVFKQHAYLYYVHVPSPPNR
jgi:hypothetical protein